MAAVTYYAIHAGGNWTAGGTWSTISTKDATRVGGATAPTSIDTCYLDDYSGSVTVDGASACLTLDENGNGAYAGTLAFGTQTLTVSDVATLRGAMTSTSGTLVVVGGVTLAGTPTGTFPTLNIAPTANNKLLTSATYTWPGALTFSTAQTTKLSGAWINTGLVTWSAGATLNYNASVAETLICQGGFTNTNNTAGNAKIILAGGTWSMSGGYNVVNSLTINPSYADVTVSGTVRYATGTLLYTSSTHSVITTGSTLTIGANCTLNTDGITWNILQTNANTITLASNFQFTTLTPNSFTFAGSYNVSCVTFSVISPYTMILKSGQTWTVTGSLSLSAAPTIQSSTTAVAYLNYTGTLANLHADKVIFTYINASGATWVTSHAYIVGDLVTTGGLSYLCAIAHTSGTFATDLGNGDWTLQATKSIDNWYGGALSNTVNIFNRTSADLKTIGAWGAGTLAIETGANARGGSGNCIKLSPSSTTDKMIWTFLVPTTASTPFTLKFYHKITSSYNGSMNITVYDTDNTTKLLAVNSVSFTDDGAYHQYSAGALTPTATGFCRVVAEILNGAVSGSIYIDDVTTI